MKKMKELFIFIFIFSLCWNCISNADQMSAENYIRKIVKPLSKKCPNEIVNFLNNGLRTKFTNNIYDYLKKHYNLVKSLYKIHNYKSLGWTNKGKNLIDRMPIPYSKIRVLSNIILLSSIYKINNNKIEYGIKDINKLFELNLILGSDPVLISKMIAVSIEKLIYKVCSDTSIFKDKVFLFNQYLKKYISNRFTNKNLINGEKKSILDACELVGKGIVKKVSGNIEPNIMNGFSVVYKKASINISNKIFKLFLNASKTGSSKEWNKANKYLKKIQKNNHEIISGGQSRITKELIACMNNDKKEFQKKIISNILEILVSIAIPNFKKAINNSDDSLNNLKSLIKNNVYH